MPLSEREQQILDQLEKDLHGDGASSSTSAPSKDERFGGLKVGIVLFVAGIMLLVWFFVSGLIIVGVASFASMVAGMVLGASSIRSEMASGGSPGERVARAVGGWEETLRRRYRDRDR
jgi:hypothetical protein